MKTRIGPSLILAVGLIHAVGSMANGSSANNRLNLGLKTDFISRKIEWNKGDPETRFDFRVFSLCTELKFPGRLSLLAFGGLGLSDFPGALFTSLPFSLEYRAGANRSLAFGGEIKKGLVSFGNFEIGATARYVYFLGSQKTWPLEGFSVTGDSQGKPTWSQLMIGPMFSFKGRSGFSPYASIALVRLWGHFKMTEKIGSLQGTEDKAFKSKGFIRGSAGVGYERLRHFNFDVEIEAIPYKGGVDFGGAIKLLYAL